MTPPLTGFFSRIVIAAVILAGSSLFATADEWRSSGSLVGESKYGEDFKHYDYVNPDAPKGGTLNSVAGGTFDSFNPFIVRGSAAAGLNYRGGLLYDTLMTKALDEAQHQPRADRRRLQISR